VRRRLKSPTGPLEGVEAAHLREQVVGVELEAERVLLASLERLAGDRSGAPADRLEALAALAEIWRPPPPLAQLRHLVERLSEGAPEHLRLAAKPVPTAMARGVESPPSPSLG
jgi:hypothetical protein